MRAKIEFTEEAKQYIKKLFDEGMNKQNILVKLEEEMNIKCSKNTLLLVYKELGLNGYKRAVHSELKPWHTLFVNDSFPDMIENCIIIDLSCHWTIEEIAKAHHTTVDSIKSHIKHPINRNTFSLVRDYNRLYNYDGEMVDCQNYNDEDRIYISNKLNSDLKGKYTIEMNKEVTICGKKYIFDLYCPEKNMYFVGHGAARQYILNPINEINELDSNSELKEINAFQIDNFTYATGSCKILNNDDLSNIIYNKILGIKLNVKRVKIDIPESQIIFWEEKRAMERFIENFNDTTIRLI